MPLLDFKTLVFIVACISLVMSGLLFILYKLKTGIKGSLSWSLGSIFLSIGLFIYFFYPLVSDYTAFVIAGTLMIAGLSQFVSGIRQFKEKKLLLALDIGLPALQLLQGTLCFYFCKEIAFRMFNYSLISLVICAIVVYEITSISSKASRKVYAISSCAFGLYGLTMLVRSIWSIAVTPDNAAESDTMNLILFFISSFTLIIITFGFVMMVLLKLSSTLSSQIASKNKLFRIFTHDIRGPIGTMAAFLEFLRTEDGISEEKRQGYLDEVEKLGESTLEFIQHISDWSKSQSATIELHKEWIDLSEVVQSSVELLQLQAKIKGVTIGNQLPKGKQVYADNYMLNTSIRNLMSNAIKFTGNGDSITIQCYKKAEFFHLTIRDTGVGMSEETIQEIMGSEPVNSKVGTNGEKGTGLGLYVTKEFIAKNNGTLSIKSKIDKGSVFTVSLPAFVN